MIKQQKILLHCADDSVMVMAMILEDDHTISRQGTPAEIEAEIAKSASAWPQDRLPLKGWSLINDEDVPYHRTFRNAWHSKDGKTIEHDMAKVRSIHLDRMRSARDRKLADLDGPWMRAKGQGKTAEAKKIETERQRLRDIPQEWEAALNQLETPEEVMGVRPDEIEDQNW